MSAELASIHDAEENAFVTNTLVLYLIIPLTNKLTKYVFVFITCGLIVEYRHSVMCTTAVTHDIIINVQYILCNVYYLEIHRKRSLLAD